MRALRSEIGTGLRSNGLGASRRLSRIHSGSLFFPAMSTTMSAERPRRASTSATSEPASRRAYFPSEQAVSFQAQRSRPGCLLRSDAYDESTASWDICGCAPRCIRSRN
jgi:hypothetical protein